MIFDPIYWLAIGAGLLLSGWAAMKVKGTFAHYAQFTTRRGMTGAQVAAAILRDNGIHDVTVEPIAGKLTDHYDPRGKVLRVSSAVSGQPQLANYDPRQPALAVPGADRLSVAAAAVIAHEVGHALQDRERDPWMTVRQAIVPAVQFGSSIAPWLIIAGVWMNLLGLAWVGLIAFGAAVVFTFVTLPVEIGASGKALAFVSSLGMAGERQTGARDVLKAAAWTYVAAALTALLTFLYYLMLIAGRRD